MELRISIVGRTPLVMHNPQLADPLNPIAQQIGALAKKQKKTEADYAEMARLEWFGGLYHEPGLGIYVPTWNVHRSFERAGTITRQGTTVIRALAMLADKVPVEYDGPKEPAKLWDRQEFRYMAAVGVQRNRVMRMRPIFRQWKLSLDVMMLEDVINLSDFTEIASLAGRAEGIGDARKLGNGRFDVEVTSA